MNRRRTTLLCASLLLTGSLQAAQPETLNYRCEDGTRFSRQGGGDAVTLIFPDRTVTLPRVRSGSGEKYTDRKLLFWGKGDEAILSTRHTMIRCRTSD